MISGLSFAVPLPLTVLVAGAIGLAGGSFLTAAIERWAAGRTVARGRSRCPACAKTLRWYELIPLVSFIMQRGRCRSCRALIPIWYVLIEAACAVAVIGVALAAAGGTLTPSPWDIPSSIVSTEGRASGASTLAAAYFAVVAVLGIGIAFYDMRTRLILPQPTRLLAALGIAAHLVGAIRGGSWLVIVPAVFSAAIAFGFFWALWFASRGRAMGRGDADVAAALALALGFPAALVGIVLAFWFGAAYGIVALAFGRMRWKSELAFAPFLILGAYVSIVFATAFVLALNIYGW